MGREGVRSEALLGGRGGERPFRFCEKPEGPNHLQVIKDVLRRI